jgi:hypothetical protein
MSYCRWGEGDLYIIPTEKGIVCLSCPLMPKHGHGWPEDFTADGPAAMLSHLQDHKTAGHNFPTRTQQRLFNEAHAAALRDTKE